MNTDGMMNTVAQVRRLAMMEALEGCHVKFPSLQAVRLFGTWQGSLRVQGIPDVCPKGPLPFAGRCGEQD